MEQTTGAIETTGAAIGPAPTKLADRIVSLDVLRGFALLGILMLNIVGMGMASAAYFDPLVGKNGLAASTLDMRVWLGVDIFAEGAMRALFSMLFGAGIVLFTTGLKARSGSLHYRRTFWLLIFGAIDAYLLLWMGDILILYAISGAMLYWLRNVSARKLFIGATVLLVALCLLHLSLGGMLSVAREAHRSVQEAEASGADVSAEQRELAEVWVDFRADTVPTPEDVAEELTIRKTSYGSAFAWNAKHFTEQLLFVAPILLLWDALVMMVFGMALFKSGVLTGSRSRSFYARLAVAGFVSGLVINGLEAYYCHSSDYDLLTTFGFMRPTYDLGRLGMALGYLGLVMWWCKSSQWAGLQSRLAAVGRMALTSYLMHSLIALILFTGAGFGLVGDLTRWQLYPIMLGIWIFQLWFSPWWLARRRFGPVEEVWRRLTYGGLG